jgi:hypothetical protein
MIGLEHSVFREMGKEKQVRIQQKYHGTKVRMKKVHT